MRLTLSHRGLHPLLWWQHVYEGGDAEHHAHWGWGRLPAFSLPAGIWPTHGHHFSRISRYTQAGVGWRSRQTHGQPRYRMATATHQPPHFHHHPESSLLSGDLYLFLHIFLYQLLIPMTPQRFFQALENCFAWVYMLFYAFHCLLTENPLQDKMLGYTS